MLHDEKPKASAEMPLFPSRVTVPKQKSPTKCTVSIRLIDAEEAKRLLSHPKNRNRNIRRDRVETHMRTMHAKRFGLSPDAIAIAKDGRLLNCFHRLTALAECGISQYFIVLDGCDASVMSFTDEGAKRTNADRDKILHPERQYHTERQAVMTTLYDLAVGQSASPSFLEIEELYQLNAEHVEWVIQHIPRRNNGVTCGVLSGIAFALGTTHNESVIEFAEQFATGVGVRSKNAPSRTLDQFLLARHGKARGERREEIDALGIARITLYAIRRHIELPRNPKQAIVLGGMGDKKNREKYSNAVDFFRAERTVASPKSEKK